MKPLDHLKIRHFCAKMTSLFRRLASGLTSEATSTVARARLTRLASLVRPEPNTTF